MSDSIIENDDKPKKLYVGCEKQLLDAAQIVLDKRETFVVVGNKDSDLVVCDALVFFEDYVRLEKITTYLKHLITTLDRIQKKVVMIKEDRIKESQNNS